MPLPSRSVAGWVGTLDPNDFYRFSLTETTRVDLSLAGTGTLALLNAAGGTLDSDTAARDARDGSIVRTLAAGDYILRVGTSGSSTSGDAYVLTLAYAEAAQPALPGADLAGNALAQARQLGIVAGGQRDLADWVGGADGVDLYRFTLLDPARLEAVLSGLTARASVALLDSAGAVLRSTDGSATRDASLISYLQPGDYYLRVQNADADTGYRLAIAGEPIRDEAGPDAAGALALGTLPAGGRVVSDWVGAADAQDWYAFTLAAAATVSLRLGLGFEGVTGSLRLALADASGTEIAADTATATGDGALAWTLPAGSWRVQVSGSGAATPYALSLGATTVADGAGNSAAAGRAVGALPAPGSSTVFSYTDWVGAADPADVYAFTVAATTEVGFLLSAASGAPGMVLRTAGGTEIANAGARWLEGDGSIRATLAPGSYALWVEDTAAAGSAYTLSIATATPSFGGPGTDSAGNTLATARPISLATPGVQRFTDWVGTADGTDWYRFTLTGDRQVDLRAAFSTASATTMVLTDAAGTTIASASGSRSADASIVRILDAGTYGVRLTNATDAGAGYNLAFQTGTVSDMAGDTRAAARLLGALGPAPQTIQDHLGPADPADWYSFSLAATSLLALSLGGLRDAARIAVTDSAGTELYATEAQAWSDGSIIAPLPVAAGGYRLLVQPLAGATPYTLNLSATAMTDGGGNTIGQATRLTPSLTASGDAAPNLMAGTAWPDEINSGGGDDTVRGLGGDDTLFGGAGTDLLIGGAGFDSLDGGPNMDAAIYDGPRGNFFFRSFHSEGRFVTVVMDLTGAQGWDTLHGVETLGFNSGNLALSLAGVQQNRTANFDAGQFDDALFWNVNDNQIMYNNVVAGGVAIGLTEIVGAMPAGWRLVTRGDLNGDGRADVLIQDGVNGTTYWGDLSAGSTVWRPLHSNLGPGMRAEAIGDFTADGSPDVLYRDASGLYRVAELDNVVHQGWITAVDTRNQWRFAGVGDFNRDGASDIMLQNVSNGITWYWDVLNGRWQFISNGRDGSWLARATGDVNGDGFSDAIFRNIFTGDIWYLDMFGGEGYAQRWGVVASGYGGWDVRGTGDMDNDSYDDIILQNMFTGEAWWRDMNMGQPTGFWGLLATQIGANWIVGM